MTLDAAQVLELLAVGLTAGLMGGMLGIGGGLIMIPAMVIFVGEPAPWGPNAIHVYKLAAITVSVVVSIPAAVRHTRAKAVLYAMMPAILPLAIVGVCGGVALAASPVFTSGHSRALQRVFGAFLELVVAFNIYQAWVSAHHEAGLRDYCPLPNRRTLIGLVIGLPTGLIAGLLGIGGGIWSVPAQHLFFGVRLRYAIATSTLIIIFVAAATSAAQAFAVQQVPGLSASDGWWLALWLAPGALLGGWIGAGLTHRLPTRWLRHTFHILLVVTGVKLMW